MATSTPPIPQTGPTSPPPSASQLTPSTTTTTTTTPSRTTPTPSTTTTSITAPTAATTATGTTTSSTTTPIPVPTTGTGGNLPFPFPREYHFPPFFTRQPNTSTRHAQHQKWSSLILSYCAYHNITKLTPFSSTPSPPSVSELFQNTAINRQLSPSDRRDILEFMRREGRVEFITGSSSKSANNDDLDGVVGSSSGDVVWVWWKTPEEWASLVENYVDETAQKGTVLTLYELVEGEDTRGQEFHGLDIELLQKALQVLVKRGKAQIFGQDDQLGIKFF